MDKAKIMEIFSSVQGEGKYAGVKQVFVRFFECNMHCDWCDTPGSIGDTSRQYKEMSLEDVFGEIFRLWDNSHSVSLTGGEPLLQKDFIKNLLVRLKKAGMPAYLETNGVCFEEMADVADGVDFVAMDLKLPSSTKCRPYWKEHEAFLKAAKGGKRDVFIKAVITSDTQHEDMVRAVDLVASIDPRLIFILQPNTYELKNGVIQKCLEFHSYCLRYLPNARVLPQVHKFMKLR